MQDTQCAYCHHQDQPTTMFKTILDHWLCNDSDTCVARGYWRDTEKGLPPRQFEVEIAVELSA